MGIRAIYLENVQYFSPPRSLVASSTRLSTPKSALAIDHWSLLRLMAFLSLLVISQRTSCNGACNSIRPSSTRKAEFQRVGKSWTTCLVLIPSSFRFPPTGLSSRLNSGNGQQVSLPGLAKTPGQACPGSPSGHSGADGQRKLTSPTPTPPRGFGKPVEH